MNGDAASVRVKADLRRWGVHLDLADCTPAASTPIIVQEIKKSTNGGSTHRFTWSCLRCGGFLPSFKPVTRAVFDQAAPYLPGTSVFFFDRVSRGALDLAAQAADAGALVMFEPSGRGDRKLFRDALEIAHIVKYANERIAGLAENEISPNLVLEIKTLGSSGLRFRLPRNRSNADWRAMRAASTESLVDSCGSGDWCSAGLLAKLGGAGVSGLEHASLPAITSALKYGQELAAWNCVFEGARGGMYVSRDNRKVVGRHDPRLLATGRVPANGSGSPAEPALVGCPKCDAA
ncbi:hypothetical protein [Segeticoccus rhizosphaerae]|uniref:hypothetical protein n=1 Tax=Segeticoccus rhizosphaerae TaxID=1104777 RepID=UPI0030831409